jgi:hypothetical protein
LVKESFRNREGLKIQNFVRNYVDNKINISIIIDNNGIIAILKVDNERM